MNAVLNTFIDRLENLQTVDAAQGLMAETLGNLGFDQFAYLGLHLPDTSLAEPILVHTYSDEWVNRYLDCKYASIDPVVEMGLASVVPFAWGGANHRKVLGKQSKTMMDEASDFGLCRGFTVPIHGARGELAALSVAVPKDNAQSCRQISAFNHDLHLIGLYFHAKMGEKIFAQGKKSKFSLSKREKESLLWAAQGKTAWETSEILFISEHTVREYIKSACRKLGVFSKNHAVVKSIMLGLIKPNL